MPGVTFSSGTTYGMSLRAAGSHPGTAVAAPAVAASLIKDRRDRPSGIRTPRSMMTGDAIQRRMALRVTFHAKAHVDLYDWHDSIHRLHRPVTVLTSDPRVDVRAMREPHEIRQGINTVPANFEGRLAVAIPGTGDGLDAAPGAAPVASDAASDGRHSRVFGSPRVLVTVLTGNLV